MIKNCGLWLKTVDFGKNRGFWLKTADFGLKNANFGKNCRF